MRDPAHYAALLFDMDGTILNSIPVVERVWSTWARGHGIDPASLFPALHGQRAADTIAGVGRADLDPQEEARIVLDMEMADTTGVTAIPGAKAFLDSLPPHRWAIVTSAPRALANLRISVAGLPMPRVLITGEDVSRGKPNPEGYLLATQRLGLAAEDCLVFEDAPAGLAAGRAAGADLLLVTATHQTPQSAPCPTIPDYLSLSIAASGDDTRPLHLTKARPTPC